MSKVLGWMPLYDDKCNLIGHAPILERSVCYNTLDMVPKRRKKMKRYRVTIEVDTLFKYKDFRKFWDGFLNEKRHLIQGMGEIVYMAIEEPETNRDILEDKS
jgi:hypothetical protein